MRQPALTGDSQPRSQHRAQPARHRRELHQLTDAGVELLARNQLLEYRGAVRCEKPIEDVERFQNRRRLKGHHACPGIFEDLAGLVDRSPDRSGCSHETVVVVETDDEAVDVGNRHWGVKNLHRQPQVRDGARQRTRRVWHSCNVAEKHLVRGTGKAQLAGCGPQAAQAAEMRRDSDAAADISANAER